MHVRGGAPGVRTLHPSSTLLEVPFPSEGPGRGLIFVGAAFVLFRGRCFCVVEEDPFHLLCFRLCTACRAGTHGAGELLLAALSASTTHDFASWLAIETLLHPRHGLTFRDSYNILHKCKR
jgi:hypothetical protein